MDNVFTCVYRGCVVNPSVNTRMIVRRKLRCVRFVSATGHHPPSRQPRRGANASRARHAPTSSTYVHVRHRHGQPQCFSSGLHAPRLELPIVNGSRRAYLQFLVCCHASDDTSSHIDT